MAIERTYNIPLRREWLRVPKHRRAKRAVKAIRNFLLQHMKTKEIKIGKYLNEEIWSRGIKSPPHHAYVTVTKDDEGLVRVELVNAPKEEKKEVKEKVAKEKASEAAPETKPADTKSEKPLEEKPAKAEKPTEKKEAKQDKPKAEKKETKPEAKKAEKKESVKKK